MNTEQAHATEIGTNRKLYGWWVLTSAGWKATFKPFATPSAVKRGMNGVLRAVPRYPLEFTPPE